jgi:hypothetical protein
MARNQPREDRVAAHSLARELTMQTHKEWNMMHLSVCVCVCGWSCVLRAAVLNYLNGFLAGAIALIASLVLARVKSCAVRVVYFKFLPAECWLSAKWSFSLSRAVGLNTFMVYKLQADNIHQDTSGKVS